MRRFGRAWATRQGPVLVNLRGTTARGAAPGAAELQGLPAWWPSSSTSPPRTTTPAGHGAPGRAPDPAGGAPGLRPAPAGQAPGRPARSRETLARRGAGGAVAVDLRRWAPGRRRSRRRRARAGMAGGPAPPGRAASGDPPGPRGAPAGACGGVAGVDQARAYLRAGTGAWWARPTFPVVLAPHRPPGERDAPLPLIACGGVTGAGRRRGPTSPPALPRVQVGSAPPGAAGRAAEAICAAPLERSPRGPTGMGRVPSRACSTSPSPAWGRRRWTWEASGRPRRPRRRPAPPGGVEQVGLVGLAQRTARRRPARPRRSSGRPRLPVLGGAGLRRLLLGPDAQGAPDDQGVQHGHVESLPVRAVLFREALPPGPLGAGGATARPRLAPEDEGVAGVPAAAQATRQGLRDGPGVAFGQGEGSSVIVSASAARTAPRGAAVEAHQAVRWGAPPVPGRRGAPSSISANS